MSLSWYRIIYTVYRHTYTLWCELAACKDRQFMSSESVPGSLFSFVLSHPLCLTHHRQFWLKAKQSWAWLHLEKTPFHLNQGDVYQRGKKYSQTVSVCLSSRPWWQVAMTHLFHFLFSNVSTCGHILWQTMQYAGVRNPVQLHIPKAQQMFHTRPTNPAWWSLSGWKLIL